MSLRRAVMLLALLGALASGGERVPVLRQVALPHSYYWRELYLPQLTGGPSSVCWTPDGQLIYAMDGSLWRQRPESALAEQLTDGPGYDHQPDCAPDGRHVVFVRYDGQGMELMLLDLATGKTAALTRNGGVNVEPRWSPDGGRLAFVSTDGTGHFLVHTAFVKNGALEGIQRITPDRRSALKRYYYSPFDHAIHPLWTRDGQGLYFVSNQEIGHGTGDLMLWRPGEAPKTILHEETNWQLRPDLSPDGTRLVTSSYLGRTWHQLWLMPAAGGPAFPLTYGDFDNRGPRWSPDGQRIAFISNRDGNTSLWTVEAFGGSQREVRIGERRYLRPRVPLNVRIVDEDGNPLPSRLSITDAEGRFHAPAGSMIRADDGFDPAIQRFEAHYVHCERMGSAWIEKTIGVQRFEAHYVHCEGAARLEVPREWLHVIASRGPAYEIAHLDLDAAKPLPDPVVVTLRRLPWPTALWGGDLHVHMNYGGTYLNTPARLLEQARAEDLDFTFNLVVNKEQRFPDQGAFRTDPDPASTPSNLLLHSQEFHTSFWGHLGLLRLRDHLLLPGYAAYSGTAAASLYPHNGAVADQAHAQGALVGYVHPYDQPVDPEKDAGLTDALPMDAALGKVDYVEVMGFSDHRATAEVWYRLLNCGIRLPAGAGTDAMANYASLRGPVGLNRVYVPAKGALVRDNCGPLYFSRDPLDRDHFLAQLKAGRGFATNGPLLDMKVQDAVPGDVLHLGPGRHRLTFKVRMRSAIPVEHLELIQNGKVAARWKGGTEAEAAGEVEIEGSGWLLLRAWSGEAHPDLLDLYPYATTSPIYIEQEGRPVRSASAARFFLRWMDRLQAAVAIHPDYRSPEERDAILRDVTAARRFYEVCAGEPTIP